MSRLNGLSSDSLLNEEKRSNSSSSLAPWPEEIGHEEAIMISCWACGRMMECDSSIAS